MHILWHHVDALYTVDSFENYYATTREAKPKLAQTWIRYHCPPVPRGAACHHCHRLDLEERFEDGNMHMRIMYP